MNQQAMDLNLLLVFEAMVEGVPLGKGA